MLVKERKEKRCGWVNYFHISNTKKREIILYLRIFNSLVLLAFIFLPSSSSNAKCARNFISNAQIVRTCAWKQNYREKKYNGKEANRRKLNTDIFWYGPHSMVTCCIDLYLKMNSSAHVNSKTAVLYGNDCCCCYCCNKQYFGIITKTISKENFTLITYLKHFNLEWKRIQRKVRTAHGKHMRKGERKSKDK